jgi:hypothetical protein
MKKLKLLLGLLITSVAGFSGNIDTPSKITDVTVFLSGAHINRTASINIPKGKSEIYFSGITPLIAKESIQVKGIGEFTILSVNHQIDDIYSEAPKTEIESLSMQIDNFNLSIEELTIKIDVYNKEVLLIENTSHASKNAEDVKIDNIKSTQEYYHTTLLDLKLGKLKLERVLKGILKEKMTVQQKLNSFKVKKSSSKSIIKVVIESETAISAKFEISYFVASAKWFPEYDARVKDISSPLTLNYKANISQQTGENWENINLTISTSNPNKCNRKPILNKWTIDTYGSHVSNKTFSSNYLTYSGQQFGKASGTVTDEYGEPIPFATVVVQGSSTGTTTDFDGRFHLTLPKNAYYLEVKLIGYRSVLQPITQDEMRISLQENADLLSAVAITNYKVPLIDRDGASEAIVVREDIAIMPARSIASMSSEIQIQSSSSTNVRGGRNSSTYYYINGVKTGVTPASYSFEKEVNTVDVSFKAENKHTINSNSAYQVVTIKEFIIPANYQYYCAPKLDKDVFLTAQVVDWRKYHLLEGQVSVYYEGTFMGTTIMDVKFISDTLNVSIGRDKDVFVQRERLKEFSQKKVFGNTVTDQRSWKIQIKNNKNTAINMLIEDQYPVSTNKQIIVKHQETHNPKVDSNTGIVSWKYETLAPANKEEMELKYSVKYPTFVNLSLE